MHVTIIKDISEFKALEKEWNALLLKSGIKNIFLTFEWLFTWWAYFGAGHYSLLIILVTDDSGIIAILPLMSSKKSGFKKIGFISSGICDYEDLITSGSTAQKKETISKAIEAMRHTEKWDILQLKGLRQDSPNFTVFKDILENPNEFKAVLTGHKDGAPYIVTSGSVDEYYSGLRKKFVSDTKRQKNRMLNDFPEISKASISDPKGIARALEELTTLHKNRRSALKTKSIFNDPVMYNFFRTIAEKFAQRGWLSLDIIRLGDITAAIHFGFRHDNRLYYYIPAFNEKFNKYSIGRLLLSGLLNDCFNSRYEQLDMMSGEEPYKSEWKPKIEKLYFLNLYPCTPRGNLAYLCFNKLNLTAKKILHKKY